MKQGLLVFFANVTLAMLLFANGCGNYFSLGTPYGETLQECESFLQKNYGVDYFSQSSPLIFDDFLVLILVNFVLFIVHRNSKQFGKIGGSLWWVFALIGIFAPRVVVQFI